jgi:hypothetical protein
MKETQMQNTVLQRAFLTSALLVVAACGGGGAGDGGDDGGGDDDPVADTTAPSLVASSPVNGEGGVPADAVLQLVFSEPMNQASVEAALSTSPFDPGEATLSWNAAGDTLTITPLQPLERGQGVGSDPSAVMPVAHEVKVGAGATDLAGNPLAAEAVVGFTTEKKMTLTIAPLDGLSRVVNNEGVAAAEGTNLILGDGAQNTFYTRALLTFSLTPLPASATGILSATLGARQLSVAGTPYADLGNLVVFHVVYEKVDAAALDASPLLSMGAMSTDGTLETKSADVTAAVADDLENFVARDGLSQYRLQFANNGDNGSDADLAQFDYKTVGLVVTYTAP